MPSVLTVPVRRLLALVLAVLAVSWALAGCGSSSGSGTTARPASATASTADGIIANPNGELPAGAVPDEAVTDLPTVNVAALPKEAVDTLRLIAQGGPFPYSKDGVTFQNREGILPRQPSGFYQEYTVITPGSKDRGARRIIAAKDGSRFYTDDHYDSFREVVTGGQS
jgi:ribonuclease T1